MKHHKEAKKQLILGLVLNGSFTIIELIGGLLANSLALLSDALHDLTDTVALSLSLYANKKAQQKPTKTKTFGYRRSTIIAALINAIVLIALTFFIFYKAYQKILNPEQVNGMMIFIIAIFGIIFNGIVVLKMWRTKEKDINIKSVFWHLTEDVLGWFGVLIAGIVIIFTGWYIIDPIISILIGLVVIYGAYGIIRETLDVFMLAVPEGINIENIIKEIKKTPKVKDAHDLHVWTVGSNYYALSGHILVKDTKISKTYSILCEVNKMLEKKFNIKHTTIEFECESCKRICY
jgi:cobalt-zinc-cadmium efflux system protein